MKVKNLNNIRHSLSHILAMAVLDLYKNVKLGIGPVIKNGFYYDFDLKASIKEEELPKIEGRMREIIGQELDFERKLWSRKKALAYFKNQPYKVELIQDKVKTGKVQVYKTGEFYDFCKGGHIENTRDLKNIAFKLINVAGAYWKGDENRPMLQRIYGIAFATELELRQYLKIQQEAQKRDHRKIGVDLGLFTFSEDVGSGLVLWLPRGTVIRQVLENWVIETEAKWGYVRVSTPHVGKEILFKTSGHLPYYKDSMYPRMKLDDAVYYLKAMNCPMHHLIFKSKLRSYKELPLRIAEYGDVYRYEKSGELFGLMRVRGMRMNDAHIYCTEEQAIEEFVNVIKLHQYYYDILGIKDYYMEMSLRDPKKKTKYLGSEKMWQKAKLFMHKAMEKSNVPYKIVPEGAAFYGPKIDFQIKSVTGRVFTASTNQIDFFMAERFGLEYVDKDGLRKRPVIIHRAPLGTHERFIGFLIEHFAGNFPVWLSPVQVLVIPISARHFIYAENITRLMRESGLRVECNQSDEPLGKKIRSAELLKIPYIVVVGAKEEVSNTLSVRERYSKELHQYRIDQFLELITFKIKTRALN